MKQIGLVLPGDQTCTLVHAKQMANAKQNSNNLFQKLIGPYRLCQNRVISDPGGFLACKLVLTHKNTWDSAEQRKRSIVKKFAKWDLSSSKCDSGSQVWLTDLSFSKSDSGSHVLFTDLSSSKSDVGYMFDNSLLLQYWRIKVAVLFKVVYCQIAHTLYSQNIVHNIAHNTTPDNGLFQWLPRPNRWYHGGFHPTCEYDM